MRTTSADETRAFGEAHGVPVQRRFRLRRNPPGKGPFSPRFSFQQRDAFVRRRAFCIARRKGLRPVSRSKSASMRRSSAT